VAQPIRGCTGVHRGTWAVIRTRAWTSTAVDPYAGPTGVEMEALDLGIRVGRAGN